MSFNLRHPRARMCVCAFNVHAADWSAGESKDVDDEFKTFKHVNTKSILKLKTVCASARSCCANTFCIFVICAWMCFLATAVAAASSEVYGKVNGLLGS